MEEIENHLGKNVDVAGFCSRNQRERFTRSADHTDVAGDDARHAQEKRNAPPNPMSLKEAIDFVEGLLRRALQ
jgi:hypothetical protein